jgi:Lecithin:cholesterol acyltransferase.
LGQIRGNESKNERAVQQEYLKSVWNTETEYNENIPGIQTRVPKFGSTYAIDQIDPVVLIKQFTDGMHELIKPLEKKLGYTDGYDLKGAGYDWRYFHNDEYFKNLTTLIEDNYNTFNEKTVIVSHSMGGLMMFRFFDMKGKEWCDKYIDSWVALSTPWTGAEKLLYVIVAGYNMGFPVNKELVREICRTFESMVLLAPNEKYWTETAPLITIKSTGEKYYAKDIRDILNTIEDFSKDDRGDILLDKAWTPLLDKYSSGDTTSVPGNVDLYCGITNQKDTFLTLNFEEDDWDSDVDLDYGDGDGTVNIGSLEFCKRMTSNFSNLGKGSHTDILGMDSTLDLVKSRACK